MVSEENRAGLYVAIPIYFFLLSFLTYCSYKRVQQRKNKLLNLNDNKNTEDKLTTHYLGGRDFGPLLTAGTLFASLFSGYTVIGVPNEAFYSGWLALRWIPSLMSICLGYFATGIRLRKLAIERNHQSPVDFITDRFRSQLLRYTIVGLQVLPTIIYLAAQVISIKSTFNGIFELHPNTALPVILIMFLILGFEWVGGLSAVATTDTFQAFVMAFSFVVLPFVILYNFGGWHELDYEDYPKPEFYQTPTIQNQFEFWQFSIINFAFFTLPHLLQRTYAAKDLKSLQIGYTIMTIGPWFTTFVGIFMGTVGVNIIGNMYNNNNYDDNEEVQVVVDDPYTAIMEAIMNVGGFSKFAGIVSITASLAAIMSTADSLIIAISQLVTVEIIHPIFIYFRGYDDDAIKTTGILKWYGKLTSLVAVVLALVIGIYWDRAITDLASQIQFPLSAQAVPTFLIGLYYHSNSDNNIDIHPWSIATGAIIATIYVFVIYFGYIKPMGENAIAVDAGVTGFILQLVVIYTCEMIRRRRSRLLRRRSRSMDDANDAKYVGGAIIAKDDVGYLQRDNKNNINNHNNQDDHHLLDDDGMICDDGRPYWDIPSSMDRFGNQNLTSILIWTSMDGIHEPITDRWWIGGLFLSISICTPWTFLTTQSQQQPPIDDNDGSFLYPPLVVNGLPWWAFKTIILCVLPTILLLKEIYKMPVTFSSSSFCSSNKNSNRYLG